MIFAALLVRGAVGRELDFAPSVIALADGVVDMAVNAGRRGAGPETGRWMRHCEDHQQRGCQGTANFPSDIVSSLSLFSAST